MLYHLFEYLENHFNMPGAGLFQFISFRAGMAVITSLVITMLMGGRLIKLLQRKQVGESVRDLGLQGQIEKSGTPTMGGVLILSSILISVFIWSDLNNIFIWITLLSTFSFGLIDSKSLN